MVLELTENEKRFGFSVVGGVDEGFRPRIDEIVEGSVLLETLMLFTKTIK